MKKLYFIFIFLLLTVNIYAQLTNESLWIYKSVDYTNSFSNTTNSVTNFYKFLVLYESWYMDIDINRIRPPINAFPGDTLYLTHYIYNVGSINDVNGINLKVGITNSINIIISNSLATGVNINTPPIASGGSTSYVVKVSIPTNYSGGFTFWITNTGSTNGPPYPYRVIVQHTINVIILDVAPYEATDQIHKITIFDGTQVLGNLDTKIFIRIEGEIFEPNSAKLYYDMNSYPDGSKPDGTVNVNRVIQLYKEGDYWVGIIPVTDPEVKPGNMVNFIISVDGKLYDRNGMVISSISPWRYQIREYVTQQPEARYTISINNKFDPREEDYYLIYKLNRRSHINVSVYNVSGELVKELKNGVEDIGKYVVKWDGKNEDGEYVAMGLYLVIIQSNEFGEIRKVIVIKR